ncbi:MAG: grpE [Gammaproteobacteria bacterium]|nr:grpE [Gammaproteobacteria bacterium]
MARKHKKSEQKAEEKSMENDAQTVVDETETVAEQTEEAPLAEEVVTEENKIEALTQEIEALKLAAAENLDKAMRALAELENVRKRTARDIENAHKYALERFIAELLPIMDSMSFGISASDNAEDIAGLREGMDLTLKMFSTTLEKFGVKVIDPQGEKFNPDRHEAVYTQELADVEPGTVISVAQKGYELNGRLVRPAIVIVAK